MKISVTDKLRLFFSTGAFFTICFLAFLLFYPRREFNDVADPASLFQQHSFELIVTMLILLVFIGIFGFALTVLVTKPIKLLAEGANRLKRGDFTCRLPVKGADEFAKLAATFNEMAATIQEQTGMMKTERDRLMTFFDHMTDGMAIITPEFKLEFANKVLRERINDDITDAECHRQLFGLDDICPGCPMERTLKGRETRWEVESGGAGSGLQGESGAKRVYEVNATPVKNSNGSISVLEILRDITQRKKSEEKLLRYSERLKSFNKRLEEKNGETENFLYIIAHDLRAPLVTIEGFSANLTRKYGDQLDEKANHYLLRIRESTKTMNSLLKSLTELSHLHTRKTPKTSIDMDKLIDQTLNDFSERIAAANVKVIRTEKLPRVYGEKIRIYQLFSNLIGNSLKFFGDQKNPEIRLGFERMNGKNVFLVSDNGIGISNKDFVNIFLPFKRLYKVEVEGQGIGLTAVKKIVEMHGGSIWLDSKLGAGTSFFIELPLEEDPSQEDDLI